EARRERLEKREAAKAAKAVRPAKAKAARHAGWGATARQRVHRVSKRGLAVLDAAWARGECPLPVRLHPEPWPVAGQAPTPLKEQDFLCHQT
ncbi:MAG: hypothetical protein K2W96_05385, partial [Gemmataceae bacterium]|nr:hypothetical protein [Gemmataceae bacterium]